MALVAFRLSKSREASRCSSRKRPTLAEKLLAAGYTVMIETSGERFVGALPREVIKIVDVKCPDSGEPETFDMANLDAVSGDDEIKFVIASRTGL